MTSPGCGRHENSPTLASNPELHSNPAGALWKAAICRSRFSAYVELPSSNLDPPLPVSTGPLCSSSRNNSRSPALDASDKKSFDEKSTELGPLVVSWRIVDCDRRLSSVRLIAASKPDLFCSRLPIPSIRKERPCTCLGKMRCADSPCGI